MSPEERSYLELVQGEIDEAVQYLDRFTGAWISLGDEAAQK